MRRLKPKQQRFRLILIALASVALGVGLMAYTLSRNMVFFYTPQMVAENAPEAGRYVRLGGRVRPGSIIRSDRLEHRFAVYDGAAETAVSYRGILPDLFRDDQGVIAEGRFDASGTFMAERVLAKHDENYMPPEVARALKEQGLWKEGGGPPAP